MEPQGLKSGYHGAVSGSGQRLPAADHSPNTTTTKAIQCPECDSAKVWRDGLRYSTFGDAIQRWLCRSCGLRFSDPEDVQKLWSRFERLERIQTKPLRPQEWTFNRQICADAKEAKNLAEVTPKEAAQREGTAAKPDEATTKGLLTKFAAYLERENYSSETAYYNFLVGLVKRGANLLDPESIKTVVAKMKKKDGTPCKDGTKMLNIEAYKAFATMMKIQWEAPTYHQEEIVPWVPEETELDQLIAACHSKRMAAFLECLKETYADPSEALRIEWIDIDFEHKTVTINHPCKGHLPGKMPVQAKLLAMLDRLPRKDKTVFATTYRGMAMSYLQVRRRVARHLNNPRILKISFTAFRHWGGTMIAYYANGNMLTVKKMLRHKTILSSMKYVGNINFEENDFETATATTPEEALKLAAAGFQKFDEFNGIHLYRRPKRFQH